MADRHEFLRHLAAGTVALSGFPRVAAAAAPTTIHVGGSPNDDMTAVVYAQRTKMFERAGLDVIIEKTNSGSAAAAAVAAGTFDIAKSSIASIFDAHEKGIPFTLIAPAAVYESKSPYGGFLMAKDTNVKSGKDIEGQTVGVASLGSVGHVAMAAWVDQHGGNVANVKFIEIPIPLVPAALDQKRIFMSETSQPTQAGAVAKGFKLFPGYDAIASRFTVAVFYTTKAFSAAHPDALKTFVRVLYDAARYANAHTDATAKIMAEYVGVPLELMEKVPRVTLGTELQLSLVQPVIDAASKYGTLKRGFPAGELVDANVSAR